MVQSVDRTLQRILARPSATTPTSCSRPTTASTSASTGSARGKGTAYDTDMRVPLLVVGPGRRARSARRGGRQHRPRADVRGPRRHGVARATAPGTRWCRRFADPASAAAHYAFFEHTWRRRRAATRSQAFTGDELSWSRRTSPCAAATRLLSARPRPRRRRRARLSGSSTSTPTRSLGSGPTLRRPADRPSSATLTAPAAGLRPLRRRPVRPTPPCRDRSAAALSQ